MCREKDDVAGNSILTKDAAPDTNSEVSLHVHPPTTNGVCV